MTERWICEYMGGGLYELRDGNHVPNNHTESSEIVRRLNRRISAEDAGGEEKQKIKDNICNHCGTRGWMDKPKENPCPYCNPMGLWAANYEPSWNQPKPTAKDEEKTIIIEIIRAFDTMVSIAKKSMDDVADSYKPTIVDLNAKLAKVDADRNRLEAVRIEKDKRIKELENPPRRILQCDLCKEAIMPGRICRSCVMKYDAPKLHAKLKSAEAVVEAARNNLAEIDVLGTAYTSMKEKYEPPYVTYVSWSRPLTLTALQAHDKPKQEPEERRKG